MQTRTEFQVPNSFWALNALTAIAAVAAVFWAPATVPLPPGFMAATALVGLYLVVCSTYAQSFFLYRWKVARAVRWYGEVVAHASYRVMGFAMMGFGAWGLATG